MRKLTRREMLALTAVGTMAAALSPTRAAPVVSGLHAEPQPRVKVGTLAALRRGPLQFSYPGSSSPAQAVLLPGGKVVAYSLLCTHMGCPVEYAAASQSFLCPCHQSIFSAARSGAVLQGPAPRALPEIRLETDKKTGTIYAVGISAPSYDESGG